ncbi:hypothetical protein [Sedimenticola selenatireducens]|uniref:hypothetical protein n=1 Tax=Sedimenticola selenatireducens TaxID=191960 RepID=UPI002356FE57|nr:hypothetical protein [Sedimenticola selenatireducens]
MVAAALIISLCMLLQIRHLETRSGVGMVTAFRGFSMPCRHGKAGASHEKPETG